eukprot:gene18523-37490_t
MILSEFFFAFFSVLIFEEVASNSCPPTVNLGIIASRFNKNGHQYHDGTHQIAAMMMAVKEINNKNDGVHDNLLPNTTIKFVLRTPTQDFLQGLEAAQYIVNEAFEGEGAHIIVGAGGDETSRAAGQILGYEKVKVNQIDFNAAGSFLSHGDLYPFYNRVNPVDAYAGGAIARFIWDHYGWTNVNLLSTGDTFGTDIELEFTDECDRLGITIENSFNFFPETPDFSHLISKVKAKGILKVFVLLMKTKDTARLLEQGYKAGLFGEGVQVVVTNYAMTVDMYRYMSKNAPVADIMKGIIGLYSPV